MADAKTKDVPKNGTELNLVEDDIQQVPVAGQLKELQNEMEFHKLLSKSPKKLAKKHPQINAQYLPVGIIEQMLDAIFPSWSFERVDSGILANSVFYEGVLTVQSPHNGKIFKRTGVAAIPIQLGKGSKPMEIENIVATAIQKNLPTAKSVALKNAAQSLGNLFGRSLNRDDEAPDMTNLWESGSSYSKLLDESE